MTNGTTRPLQALSDDELNMWADIYADARIGEMTEKPFSEFVRDPWNTLVAAGQESAPESIERGFKPLLPAQAAVAKRVQAEWDSRDRAATAKNHLRLVSTR